MWGAIGGLLIGALVSYCCESSWWWLIAWGVGGLICELAARVQGGAELSGAIVDCVDIGAELGSCDFSGGDSGSSSD